MLDYGSPLPLCRCPASMWVGTRSVICTSTVCTRQPVCCGGRGLAYVRFSCRRLSTVPMTPMRKTLGNLGRTQLYNRNSQ
jgi:hypothetical protein